MSVHVNPKPYQDLEDESISYEAWVNKHGEHFKKPEWLANEDLTHIPLRARAIFERNCAPVAVPADGRDFKVYIGPPRDEYSTFYSVGAIQLPLQCGLHAIAIMDIDGFMCRLRETDTVYRNATITPHEANGPVPQTYTLFTRDAPVESRTVTVSALSSAFADAAKHSVWFIGATGAFVSMPFYLELMYRRCTLTAAKIDACIVLEKSIIREKTRALEMFHGPRPPTTTVHNGESLGFLCARYRKTTEELVLHLSDREFSMMNTTFPVLGPALSTCTSTRVSPSVCFYDVPLKPFSWVYRSDTWVGRVLLQTFVSSQSQPQLHLEKIPAFLLLTAIYIDL